MKTKVVTEQYESLFEKDLNLEVISLESKGNKVIDIKFSTAHKVTVGIFYSVMIIFE